MPEYTIKSGKIRRDDKTYFPGDKINLPEEIAAVLPKDRLVTLQVKGDPEPILPDAEPEPVQEPDPQPQNETRNKKNRR
jgi:hypothetical protein